MDPRRAAQIAIMLAIPIVAVYVVAPAVRARVGQTTMLWTDVGLLAFGIVLIVVSRLLPTAVRRRKP